MSHRGAETRPARLEIWPRPLAPQTAQPPKLPAVDSSHLVEHDHLEGLPEPEKNQGSPPRRAPRSKPPLGCCSPRLRRSRGPCPSMPQHVADAPALAQLLITLPAGDATPNHRSGGDVTTPSCSEGSAKRASLLALLLGALCQVTPGVSYMYLKCTISVRTGHEHIILITTSLHFMRTPSFASCLFT